MSSATKCCVYISSVGTSGDTNPLDALVGENGGVVSSLVHGLVVAGGLEVITDFFGEGAEIKVFGVIDDRSVIA